MTNISKKTNDFYNRFEIQLKESQNWPGIYMFKFIIKNNFKDLDKLKAILSEYKGDFKVKSSDKGNYKSISFESFLSSFVLNAIQKSIWEKQPSNDSSLNGRGFRTS